MSGERVHVFFSEEDGGYIANALDLRYCSAFGTTYEEVLKEMDVALALHREVRGELLVAAHNTLELLKLLRRDNAIAGNHYGALKAGLAEAIAKVEGS